MGPHSLELYKLLSNQIEGLRQAQRDARRFYTGINIAGFSLLFSIESERALSINVKTGLILGLLCLCMLWFNATSYYARSIRVKSACLLDLEKPLSISVFEEELKALHGSTRLPNSFAERSMIALLMGAYVVLLGAVNADGVLAPIQQWIATTFR